jgi:hypothetical protein
MLTAVLNEPAAYSSGSRTSMSIMLCGFSAKIFSKVAMSMEPSSVPALTATVAGDAP